MLKKFHDFLLFSRFDLYGLLDMIALVRLEVKKSTHTDRLYRT